MFLINPLQVNINNMFLQKNLDVPNFKRSSAKDNITCIFLSNTWLHRGQSVAQGLPHWVFDHTHLRHEV